jgi:Pyruvate/2-oxoacid:ferredoxin oxidoreductase delta subunit
MKNLKPVVDFRRCFASQNVCTAIKFCPAGAVSYIEVDEPITDKTLNCNCDERESLGLKPISVEGYSAGCDCGSGCDGGDDPLYGCGGTPYGRIVIDYDKCMRCGVCVRECCGTAIGMFPEHFKVDKIDGKPKADCCCDGGCC